MENIQQTPGANRLHIGVFGRTNSGKSSLINALTGQQVSIVADLAGTTTDPVYKAMELHPLGACTIIDTAGFDDVTALGEKRLEKTRLAAERTDLAVLVVSAAGADRACGGADDGSKADAAYEADEEHWDDVLRPELEWYDYFKKRAVPAIFVVNKADEDAARANAIAAWLSNKLGEEALSVSASSKEGIDGVRLALARRLPENYGQQLILGDLITENDLVLLVMPQDIQAPKGRLILPQVQTLRELLDRRCTAVCCTTDQLARTLGALNAPPKLIVTDSQAFGYVYEHKPKESMLTSFSVLFAAYKGDLPFYVQGAKQLDALRPDSRVLIAECCTHVPLEEDIGRVKLPRMLRARAGEQLTVDVVGGTDFPQDLSGYDLIIQCGACMFNRAYVMARIGRAREQRAPMTNYGVAIAHLTGILEKIALPGCGGDREGVRLN